MQIEFVNRHREIEILNNKKSLLGKDKCTLIINGVSGVGKSALTKRFVLSSMSSTPSIKVSINQAEKNAYSTGYFINKMASTFNNNAKSDNRLFTFEQYLRRNKPSNVVLSKIGDSIKKDITSNIPGGNTLKSVFDLLAGQSNFDEKSMFTSTYSETQFLLSEYIRSECKRIPVILNIENIQSIDTFSLEQLVKIIGESNNCLFILEFTQDDSSGYSIGEIVDFLEKDNLECNILEIKPLSIDDIKKIIEVNPKISWTLIQQSYINWKGNLRPLVDIMARLKYQIPIYEGTSNYNLVTATLEHLKSIPKSELFLLYVIYWHKEPVEIDMLRKLITFKEAFNILYDIDLTLRNLREKFLIIEKEDKIAIAHDSIVTEFQQLVENDVYTLLSQKFWLESYNNLLQQSDLYFSKGHILKKVLYYASYIEDGERIYELLDLISLEALRSRNPEIMIKYVLQVKKMLEEQDNKRSNIRINQINLWLIELYYKLGKALAAWEILQYGIHLKETEIVLKAILLEQTGKHAEAIKYSNYHLAKPNSPNKELALRLVRLVTNYDIGNEAETCSEFHQLYNNHRFLDCFEYGFLLRNAELVFSFKDSLPYYKESISVFKKHKAIRQSAFSRITYGVHLGLTGQFQKAKTEFLKATQDLGDVITERHTLYNNLAVLNLYQRKKLHEAENLLRQAMMTADGDFERLSIHMNLFVVMDWTQKNEEAERIIPSINNIIKNKSFACKDILRFAYFNIYKFYESRNCEQKANIYKLKLDNIGIPDIPLWKKWMNNINMPEDDELVIYGSIDRAVTFLCNWNMEFDSNLMHYE